jgi:endo-1,4-beta-xylanase
MSCLNRFFLAFVALIASIHFAHSATQVLPADTIATVGGYGGAGDSVTPIAINNAQLPFGKALRIVRASNSADSFSAAAIWTTRAAVRKGDLLVATFYLRKVGATGGPVKADISFQLNDPPYTYSVSSTLPVDTQRFQKYAIPFRAVQDYAAGKTNFQIRYGLIPQTFDVGGVSVVNHGQVDGNIPKAISDTFAYYYPGRADPRAGWRAKALASIEATRKGSMTLRVVNSRQQPVNGATVKIVQTQSPFIWGTAASAISLVCKIDAGDSNRPCPTTDQLGEKPVRPSDYRKLRAALLENFNGGSFYNDLKWTEWVNDQQLALDGIAWMKRKGLRLWRGHNLIWPSFAPDYLMPQQLINASTPPDEAKRVIDDHFEQQLTVLKGQIPEWDVVNEPFGNYDVQGRIAAPGVAEVAGKLPTTAIADWFRNARRIDPKTKLFVNDYSILENLNPAAQQYDLALIKYIKGQGAPVDGIGFQAHFGAAGPVFSEMQESIDDFAPLVERMSITEFDFTTLDPRLQRDLTEDFMTFIYGQPKFGTFQMWGFWDGDHWLGNGPLYNRDWSLKPSGEVWRRLTQKAWRTKVTRQTAQNGEVKLRAFYGRYRISITAGGKTCTVPANFNRAGMIDVRFAC